MKLVYPAVFTPLDDSDGYCVSFPDLPGCVTQGSSLADAIEMAADAASGWVLDEIEDGNDIPKSSPADEVELDGDSFMSLVVLNMDEYAEKYGSKGVIKSCTIPAWLNTLAEIAHIDFSDALKEALISRLGM